MSVHSGIDLPGIYFDEAYIAHALFPEPPGGPNWSLEIFGHTIPVMIMSYAGALKAWLQAPILSLFEPSAATARFPSLVIAAATIWTLFFFSDRAFGRTTALIASWLLATDPTFLFAARLDWGPVAIQQLCSIAGVALILSWTADAKTTKLFLGFFVFGLGVFDKLSFQWMIIAHCAAAMLIFRQDVLQRMTVRSLSLATAGFLFGASPVIAYRLIDYQPQFSAQLETDPARLGEKHRSLPLSLDGTMASGWMFATSAERPAPTRDRFDELLETYFGGQSQARGRKTFLVPAFLLAIIALPWTLRSRFRKGLLYVLVFCGIALLQMAAIKDGGAIHHQVLIHPFPQLFIAASIAALATRFRRAKAVWLTLTVAPLLIANLACGAQLYRDGLRFGGTPLWSEAIYPLHRELQSAAF